MMRRNSIGKASTFKLYAARVKYQEYLQNIEQCPMAIKFPSMLEEIKTTSESLYDICYSFKEESPCTRGLNYDNRYLGFHSTDNFMIYHEYLGNAKEAYLMGQFNNYSPTLHQMSPDSDIGEGWFKLQWDLTEHRLDENSRIKLRVIDQSDKEWIGPPPSCRVVEGQFGIFRKNTIRPQLTLNHKLFHLLAYSIDLNVLPLEKCSKFIEYHSDLLECYNAVILKNLFEQKKSLIHKFSLTPQKSDLLEEVVERLSRLGLKVVLEWNFYPAEMIEPTGIDTLYGKETGACQWQFDLTEDSTMIFYLSNISHFFKQFGIRGLHFTKVHNLCRAKNGILFVKLINILCERLSEDAITLASSKSFIPGLSEPIREGGLGFSFTFNYHQSLSLDQQHQSLYDVVKQIQASSNCLSLTFNNMQKEDYIYLLFSFVISKQGVFTRGPVEAIKPELIKILKLRKQEELFHEETEMLRVSDDCVIVKRGAVMFLFNFSRETASVEGNFKDKHILFSDIEEDSKIGDQLLQLSGYNCLVLEGEQQEVSV